MKIQFSYPIWGSEHLTLETFFQKLKDAGYQAVEMGVPSDKSDTDKLQNLLKEYDLKLIAQQCIHTPLDAEAYMKAMEDYLYHLASFQPVLINSHTGRDYYSFVENCRLFALCEEVEKKSGIPIYHETHRGRALFSTNSTKDFLDQFPALRLTADFSHWSCVSESLLKEQQDFMNLAMQRTGYIHARVGNEQSPQVNHPAAQENKEAVNAHVNWWMNILTNAKNCGEKEFWICTEFGPSPYLPTLPFTNQPVASQLEVNLFIKELIVSSWADKDKSSNY